jgi:hypothetical protein
MSTPWVEPVHPTLKTVDVLGVPSPALNRRMIVAGSHGPDPISHVHCPPESTQNEPFGQAPPHCGADVAEHGTVVVVVLVVVLVVVVVVALGSSS